MSSRLQISRRDFMKGVAMSLAAGSSLSPLELMAMEQRRPPKGGYPPALTGMRGSHPGSFEVAHSLILPGANFARPSQQTDETGPRSYDHVNEVDSDARHSKHIDDEVAFRDYQLRFSTGNASDRTQRFSYWTIMTILAVMRNGTNSKSEARHLSVMVAASLSMVRQIILLRPSSY